VIELRSNYRSSARSASLYVESGEEAMLISNVASREVCGEVTLEILMAVVCAPVRVWHCRLCGKVNRNEFYDDAVAAVSRDFAVCLLKMDFYLEMVFAEG
jgi:hypothetical protein